MVTSARSSCSAHSWHGRCTTASRSSAAPIPARPISGSVGAIAIRLRSSSGRCSTWWLVSGSIPTLSACRRSSGRQRGTSVSVQEEIKRLTAPDILARKGGEPIVCLTSYHAHTARLVDKYCDVVLVGDSLGMVMHGMETTVPVTLDMMILQGRAVMRGSRRALVVVDMPFGSYEESKEQAFMNTARVLKETG